MEMNISQLTDQQGSIQMIGQYWTSEEFDLFQKHVRVFLDKGVTQIVVDLSRVSFMSSQGLGSLVTVFSEVKDKSGELILFKPQGCVKEVLEISGLNLPMKIIHTTEELDQIS